MKFVWGLLALVIVAVAALTIRPDMLPFTADLVLQAPFTQIMAMRPWIAAVLLVTCIFFLIVGIVRSRLVDGGDIAATVSACFLIIGLVHLGMLWARGWNDLGQLSPDPGVSVSGTGNGAITMLTYNTMGGEVDADSVVESLVANGVDVAVLPETSTETGEQIATLAAQQGIEFQQFDNSVSRYEADFESTVLLVSTALGEYQQIPADIELSSTVQAAPVSGNGPVLVGVHPIAPVVDLMDRWRSEISQVYSLCGKPGYVVAGDFNSTVDHQRALGVTCSDAVAEASMGGLGSWPSKMPELFGAPIDRVLHDSTYQGTEATFLQEGSSDHRGVIVRMVPDSPAQ